MAAQKILQILLICMACTVVIYCRPMIDTSDIVKDIRDIENILNEADTDNDDDNDDDSNDSNASDNDSKEEADTDETTSQESSDAALKNETNNNSSVDARTITDVSNTTSDSNATVSNESTKNAEVPSNPSPDNPSPNITEDATPDSNATATALSSNDTRKPAAEKKGVIGIGQRLTSEQKDTPDTNGATALPVAVPNGESSSFSSNDLMNYTSAAILGHSKDQTAKPAESSPAILVSKESQDAPKVEEIKIKNVSEEDTDKAEKEDSTLEKESSADSTPNNDLNGEEDKSQKKDVAIRTNKVNKVISSVASNKTSENEDNNDDNEADDDDNDNDDDDDDDGDDGGENVTAKHGASNEDDKMEIEEEDVNDEATAAETENPKSKDVENVNTHGQGDRVKMFFISPYERQAHARQILTYPATNAHGWGQNHQYGPAHIWNSDYPYYAYGYSWGCGGEHGNNGNNGHGTSRKSNIGANVASKGNSDKERKSKEKSSKKKKSEKGARHSKGDWICRDYMLVPAATHGPIVNPDVYDEENGVAREHVHTYGHDIACHEDDTQCKQRQVIGSMAGGSLFGDGMGGLGMGFPGVPGIHAGLSGYNAMGGLGDHQEQEQNCGHGHCNYHGHGHGGGGGGYGGGGGGYGGGEEGYGGGHGNGGGDGYGMSHYITTPGREIANIWSYQQPDINYMSPRVIEVENSVKKSYNPRKGRYGYASYTDNENYEDVGDDGNSQYTEDERDERNNERIFHKFSSPSSSDTWENVGLGRSHQKSEYQAWSPRSISENGGFSANNDDKGIENSFQDGEKDLQLNKEYIGKLNDEGVAKAVHSALHSERKLGLEGHISINGVNKNFNYKSKIRKPKDKVGTTRQDIAMPDEQAMMEITKQRQLIGSLGASTLFSDNVGGMGLGHPGIPGMSSGIAGIPGEYGGNGGFSHGWSGEGQPGLHPHGWSQHYMVNHGNQGMDMDHLPSYHSESLGTNEETGTRRAEIYPPEADYGQSVRNLNQPPVIVDESQNSQVQPQKMSEIERMVHDVSDSIDKTNKKLEAIQGGKRQITPAFTPVVSEPAAVPDIRYPVPAADRYPLGAGYIWPSANYGHQYGGPYAWSKSSTPTKEEKPKSESKGEKSKVEKQHGKSKVAGTVSKQVKNGSKKYDIHATKERRSTAKTTKKHRYTEKVASKRQFLSRPYGQAPRSDIYSPYHSGMSMYGSGGMGYPMSHGAGYGGHAGQERAYTRHFHQMGDLSGGYGSAYQGGLQGGFRHRIHAHSFMPTLSGRYAGYASHEAGAYGGGSPMGGYHHMSMFGGGGGGGGGGGAGGGYENAGMSSGMMGGHDAGAFMGGHDASGFVGHEARAADPYGAGGHGVEGGYGSLSGMGGGMSSYTHGMGGGMTEERQQGQESSPLGHGYSHSMQYGMPSEDSRSGYGSSRHSVYGGGLGSLGGPVPGGFELPSSLGGGGGSLGSSLSSLVGGGGGGSLSGSLEQSLSSGSSHSIDGGYLGSTGAAAAAAGYGRQSSMEQQPEQPSGDPTSYYGQSSSMVGGSPQAMYLPNGMPIPTYGSDIRGMSGLDYSAAAKRTTVPKSHHHRHQKHSE